MNCLKKTFQYSKQNSNFLIGFLVISVAFTILFENTIRHLDFKNKIENFESLCRLVTPRIQLGAFRDAQEMLNSIYSDHSIHDIKIVAVVSVENQFFVTKPNVNDFSNEFKCKLSGISNADVNFYFNKLSFSWFIRILFLFLIYIIILLIAVNFGRVQKKRLNEENKLNMILQIEKVARQVAHDIRSPLSALNIITSTLNDVPEDKRLLIRNSVQRINDIANDLLQKGKANANADKTSLSAMTSTNLAYISPSNTPTKNSILSTPNEQEVLKKQNYSFLVSTVVDNIVSEKRIQFREKINVHINVDLKNSFGLFVNANPNELSRVISNLINNSVEALPNQSGNIEVSVFTNSDSKVCIQIRDNGSGIPKHILEKLGQAGITHGKENSQSGSGLGVYHAIKTIQEFGGQIKFQSVTAEDLKHINRSTGTTITIELPKSDPPDWFAESIQLNPGQEFVTVDDDISIHQIWKGRLQSLKSSEQNIKITSFTSAKEFREYFNKHLNSNSPRIFLIDYEFLNQNDNGLKIITDLGIQDKAILVTSRFDEPHIRSECEAQKIKILPKQLAGQITITFTNTKTNTNSTVTTSNNSTIEVLENLSNSMELLKYNLCLIDDDKLLVHSIWGMVAKEKGLNIKMFERPEDFLSQASQIDKSTPIYVDVSLGNNINGVEVAKEIYELGFKNINLATGYDSETIKVPSFIHQVVGKDFPL